MLYVERIWSSTKCSGMREWGEEGKTVKQGRTGEEERKRYGEKGRNKGME